MALISLQDVSIGFGGPRLLEDINLQIESGERVGLLGRNGMGKSTLLKLVSGERKACRIVERLPVSRISVWRIFRRKCRMT